MLKEVKDFKYPGSRVNSTERDLTVRKALALRALNGMSSVWNSTLPRRVKPSFFYAAVESVLLYGRECWTLKPTLQKSLDGCLHQNAACSTSHQQEHTYYQQDPA